MCIIYIYILYIYIYCVCVSVFVCVSTGDNGGGLAVDRRKDARAGHIYGSGCPRS